MARIFTDGAEMGDTKFWDAPSIGYTLSPARYPVGYSQSNNFGDALNPFLYKLMTGRDIIHASFEDSPKIVACGSIAHTALPHDIVWGAGANPDLKLKSDETTQITAVRGPLTAEMFYEHGHEDITEVYGDPALLLPDFYPNRMMVEDEFKVIPHYVDYSLVSGVPIVNVMGEDVEYTLNKIIACSFVVSSALHGIVVAEAYGIPAVWVEFSDNVAGYGFKFRDYYLGTNRLYPEPLNLRGGWTDKTFSEVRAIAKEWEPPSFDKDSLIGTCPFGWSLTNLKRWKSIGTLWKKRNQLISSLCPNGVSVFEFGAGAQELRPLLEAKGCSYIPSDIIRRTPDTIICDLNQKNYPDLSSYDVIIFSGVLEYVIYVAEIFIEISKYPNIKQVIFSFNDLPKDMRNYNGYLNFLSGGDVMDIANRLCQFTSNEIINYSSSEVVCVLTR